MLECMLSVFFSFKHGVIDNIANAVDVGVVGVVVVIADVDDTVDAIAVLV